MYDYTKFHKGYYEAIEDLEDADQLIMYKAICRFGLYEEEPELTGISKTIWKIIKPMIDGNHKNTENGKKGGRPKKDAKKETTAPSSKKKEVSNLDKINNIYKLLKDRNQSLVDKITTSEYEFIDNLSESNKTIIFELLSDEIDDFSSFDSDKIQKIYTFMRKTFKEGEGTYSMNGGKSKHREDHITKEIHKQTSLNRSSLRDLKADNGEIEFYKGFWDNFKDKTVTVMGIEYDVNLSEQMFFLSGTKKTGKFTEGRILEEIWKLQKQGK